MSIPSVNFDDEIEVVMPSYKGGQYADLVLQPIGSVDENEIEEFIENLFTTHEQARYLNFIGHIYDKDSRTLKLYIII